MQFLLEWVFRFILEDQVAKLSVYGTIVELSENFLLVFLGQFLEWLIDLPALGDYCEYFLEDRVTNNVPALFELDIHGGIDSGSDNLVLFIELGLLIKFRCYHDYVSACM